MAACVSEQQMMIYFVDIIIIDVHFRKGLKSCCNEIYSAPFALPFNAAHYLDTFWSPSSEQNKIWHQKHYLGVTFILDIRYLRH